MSEKMADLREVQRKLQALRLKRPRTFDNDQKMGRLMAREEKLYSHPEVIAELDRQNGQT